MSAPTLEWLRELSRRGYRDLARSIAGAIVDGSRTYTIEECESTIASLEARCPSSLILTDLHPWPWPRVDLLGKPRPDCGSARFECRPDEALAAGFLTAAMLPAGRKRQFRTGSIDDDPAEPWISVRKESSINIVVSITVEEAVPDSHPLAMFRPSVIRTGGLATMGGLRLIVDNGRVLQ